jgi:hypothetical protein
MAYTTINKGSLYMNPVLYTGNGGTQSLTGVNFQPDFTWVKERGGANSHMLADSVRGATKILFSNLTNAEDTDANSITSFDSDGFGVGSSGNVNASGDTYVGWNWKAGGTAVSNTDGDITSSVSANTTSGFSIVSYTGNATSGATVGHGLGVTPKMIIIKNTSALENWIVYHTALGNTKNLYLDATNGEDTRSNTFNNTSPTSSVFSIGNASGVNNSGNSMIAYCFADVKGYSKFGSYVGNGSTDGTFVYTGFKPAFIIWKNASSATQWILLDNKRLGYNPSNYSLFPNNTDSDADGSAISADLLSNGFKLRTTSEHDNQSGSTFIYMAFAENPLVSNTSGGIPTTAR